MKNHTINIKQYMEYQNTSDTALDTIYLNDWSNSYATKNTPLAERFAEEYNTNFHFAKNEERGFTALTSLTTEDFTTLAFERLEDHPDVIRVTLNSPLLPGQSYKLKLNYIIKVPSSKFTSYGVTGLNEFNLKYWYITPAVFDGEWHYYSNKNLDDLYVPVADINLQVTIPGIT